jgi:putative heme iron utilization protein
VEGFRALLEAEAHGVLATLSARRAGWPFASVVAYALSAEAEPLLLLSELAEHTRNLRAEPRASLLVTDSAAAADPLAGSRLTLLGTIQPTTSDTARSAYLARHPPASDYLQMGDFHLYVLTLSEARYVGGFGDMGWLDGARLRAALSPR